VLSEWWEAGIDSKECVYIEGLLIANKYIERFSVCKAIEKSSSR
jgi:hypothetical protein